MLNILLADDDNLVRKGLKMLLDSDKRFNVIGEATNGMEVLGLLDQGLNPDIILSDVSMPEMDGISLIKAVVEKKHPAKMVMLSMMDSKKTIEKCFSAGAVAYLLKSVHPQEFAFAMKLVTSGQRYLSAELSIGLIMDTIDRGSTLSAQAYLDVEFSPRELEVLGLMAEGLTNSEMSDRLFLSKRTVEGHRQTLIEKTGCRNTASLIKFAVSNGIIP